jgi:hypothetical protein
MTRYRCQKLGLITPRIPPPQRQNQPNSSARADTAGSTRSARSTRPTGSTGPNRPKVDVDAVIAKPVVITVIRINGT